MSTKRKLALLCLLAIVLLLTPTVVESAKASTGTYIIAIDQVHGSHSYPHHITNVAESLGCEIHNIGGNTIVESDLQNVTILVIPSPSTPYYTTQEIGLVHDFVNNGGGLYIIVMSTYLPMAQYNDFYESFGFKITGDKAWLQYPWIKNVTETHPIFKGVQQIEIDWLGVGTVASLMVVEQPAEVLLQSEGKPLFLVSNFGSGRIFVDLTNYGLGYENDKYDNLRVVKNAIIWLSHDAIPEFPSFLILPLFMVATLLAAIIYKRKHTL
jgi:hypothetical protein